MNSLFENRFVYTLGRFSLPLYYTQRIGFIILNNSRLGELRVREQILFCVGMSFVTAFAVEPLAKLFMKGFNKKVTLLTNR